ncbi:EamA family transporter [Tumebacillus sp. DT12]|uniref:EamA family transporter n=1 Tax=Tumebacillus lacus TaxID=2995335 RepID=A0ABT3WYS6_9BACL|nr:EamA family transporter [Tumebacillus lacus]MCX7569834.1 EamA family transporter [Tumebacillus lacus]
MKMMIAYMTMCLIFGTTFLTIKIGLEGGMPPFFFAGSRFFLAGVMMLFLLRGAKTLKQLTRQQVKEIALGGVGLTGIQFAAVYWAAQYLPSGTVAILAGTSPIFTSLLAMWTGQQKRSLHLMIGIVLGFFGTYLIATGTSHETSTGEQELADLGIGLILFVKFLYAFALTRFQKHTRSVPTMTSNGLQMTAGGFFLLLLSLCFEQVTPSAYSPAAFGALIYLIVIGSVVGYSIFYWLLRVTNTVFPTTWTFVSPVIAMCVGALYMNEKITFAMGLGAVTVISSVVLLNREGLGGNSKRLQTDTIKGDR